MKKLFLTFFVLLFPLLAFGQVAQPAANRFACLPSPLGSGTKAVVRSTTKGDFAAWYCPSQDLPAMVVCLKASCGLAGVKRAVATFVTSPSTEALNAAMAAYQRNAYTDKELVAVWLPYADEIRKSGQ